MSAATGIARDGMATKVMSGQVMSGLRTLARAGRIISDPAAASGATIRREWMEALSMDRDRDMHDDEPLPSSSALL